MFSTFIVAVLFLWKNLTSVLLVGLPVYTFLLVTMCWRSLALLFIAKVSHDVKIFLDFSSIYLISKNEIFQNFGNVLRIICAISSVLFVISDTMIAIDKYYVPISNSSVRLSFYMPEIQSIRFNYESSILHNSLKVWIMSTYYAAQFGITLSVIDIEKQKLK